MEKKRILVVDASALIAGYNPLSIREEQYSVPAVGEELVSGSLPHTRFRTAVESRRLRVQVPSPTFIERAREESKKIGDVAFLSEADIQVLALALELKNAGYHPFIVTDDYSIQNVANQVGIEFTPLATFGIRYRQYWILYCPACHRRYPADYRQKTCEVCGTKLKRKPLRKVPIKEGEAS